MALPAPHDHGIVIVVQVHTMTLPIQHFSSPGVHRVFKHGFTVQDLAEPIVSFDDSTPGSLVMPILETKDFDIVGVRSCGVIVGYAERQHLSDNPIGECLRMISPAEIIAPAHDLTQVIAKLNHSPHLFVTSFGHISGIVTRSDLQKPPLRMWLFGMVSLIEMAFVRLIEVHFPEESWQSLMTEKRLASARALLEERKRRKQNLNLMDCLQLSDKGQIIVRTEELRIKVGFPSRNRGEMVIGKLEQLRNNLAHSQELTENEWGIIVALSENIDRILGIAQ